MRASSSSLPVSCAYRPQHFVSLPSLFLRESGGDFLQIWYAPVRRELVYELREILRELRQKILLADTGLLCSIADGCLSKRRAQLTGLDGLVLTGSDPGFGDLAVACALQLIKETTKAANKAAILGWRTSPAALTGLRLTCRAATGEHPAYKKCTETKQERFC